MEMLLSVNQACYCDFCMRAWAQG